jgi:acetyl esterase/lipase
MRRGLNRPLRMRGLLALCALLALIVAPSSRPASAVRVEKNLLYESRGVAASQRLDAYLPGGTTARPGVVVVHGGGWTAGSKDSVDAYAMRLADHGWDAFAVDYRLAPRNRYPAAVEDVRAALGWLDSHATKFGLDPRRLALLGFSAGGNLALEAALAPHVPQLAAIAVWSAPTDLPAFVHTSHNRYALSSIRAFVGCPEAACTPRYREASPITHVTTSMPPVLLANSTDEIVPLTQARSFVRAARGDHVPVTLLVVPGSRHAVEYARVAWQPTLAFLRLHLR